MLELIKTLAAEKTLILSSHNLSDVDEVCNHAAVLSQGQLIFHGSLQDLKGRIRKNHYELDLEGDQKSISRCVQQIKGLNDVKQVILRQRRLELKLDEETLNTAVLAEGVPGAGREQGDAGQRPQRRPADRAGVPGPGREGRVARLRAAVSAAEAA